MVVSIRHESRSQIATRMWLELSAIPARAGCMVAGSPPASAQAKTCSSLVSFRYASYAAFSVKGLSMKDGAMPRLASLSLSPPPPAGPHALRVVPPAKP
eukprot:2507536-Prymnesium_polylepis.1